MFLLVCTFEGGTQTKQIVLFHLGHIGEKKKEEDGKVEIEENESVSLTWVQCVSV